MTLEFYPLLWDFGDYLDSHVLPKELFRLDNQAKKFVSRCLPESLSDSPQLNRYLQLIQRLFIQNGAFIHPTTKKSVKKSKAVSCKKFYLSEVWSDILRKDTFDSDFSLSDTDSGIESDFEKYYHSESKLKYLEYSPKNDKNNTKKTTPKKKKNSNKKPIENSRANRTIGVLGFKLMKLLQTKQYSRESLAEKTEFSKQRVCTVLSIYKLLNLVVEDPKTNLLYWESEQSLLIPDLQKYIKNLILAKNYRRKLAKKVLYLSKKLGEKYQKKQEYRSKCDNVIELIQKNTTKSSTKTSIDLKLEEYPKDILLKIQRIKHKLRQFRKRRVHFEKVDSKKKLKKLSNQTLNKILTNSKYKSQSKSKGKIKDKVKINIYDNENDNENDNKNNNDNDNNNNNNNNNDNKKTPKKKKIIIKVMSKSNKKKKRIKKRVTRKKFPKKKKKIKTFSGYKLYPKHSKSFHDYSELRKKRERKKRERTEKKKLKEKRFNKSNYNKKRKKRIKKKKKKKKKKHSTKKANQNINSSLGSSSDTFSGSISGSFSDSFNGSLSDSFSDSFSDSLSDIKFSSLKKKRFGSFDNSEDSKEFDNNSNTSSKVKRKKKEIREYEDVYSSNSEGDNNHGQDKKKTLNKEFVFDKNENNKLIEEFNIDSLNDKLKETKIIQSTPNNKQKKKRNKKEIDEDEDEDENEKDDEEGGVKREKGGERDDDENDNIYEYNSDEDLDQVDVVVDIFLDEKYDQNYHLAKMLLQNQTNQDQLENGLSPIIPVDSQDLFSESENIESYNPESGLYYSDLFESSVTTFYSLPNKSDNENDNGNEHGNENGNENENLLLPDLNYDEKDKEKEKDFTQISLASSMEKMLFDKPNLNEKKKFHATSTKLIDWEKDDDNEKIY
ncbi:cyclic amp receptor-like protein g [Anaeramoeba flamelloides]|uniref:Cyclic amp receptor-like protein g n=1 Tax=Anaeramoeba flamelloides TaxID=1746091 RepID=A0ABQ8YUP9_9EUKA|nr:cyclic amp receptor-like protein g [Anaeramoeba flamelloides]